MRPSTIGRVAGLWMAVAAITACGDKPQTLEAGGKSHGGRASDGSTSTAFTVPGWKPGDPSSWEQQMKARNQNQNEYSRSR